MTLGNGSFVRSLTGSAPDDRRRITFSYEAIYDEGASNRAGRPIYRDEERIEIAFPGNQLNIWHGRVTDEHRQLYEREYEAFLKGHEVAINGTPIEELSILSKAQVRELKHFNIYTIEDGAMLSEQAVQSIGMGGNKIRELCKRYLEKAKDLQPLAELVAVRENLEGKNAMLEHQMAEMNRMVIGLQAQLNAYAQAPRAPESIAAHQPDPYNHGAALPLPPATSSLDNLGAEPAPRRPGRPRKAA